MKTSLESGSDRDTLIVLGIKPTANDWG